MKKAPSHPFLKKKRNIARAVESNNSSFKHYQLRAVKEGGILSPSSCGCALEAFVMFYQHAQTAATLVYKLSILTQVVAALDGTHSARDVEMSR